MAHHRRISLWWSWRPTSPSTPDPSYPTATTTPKSKKKNMKTAGTTAPSTSPPTKTSPISTSFSSSASRAPTKTLTASSVSSASTILVCTTLFFFRVFDCACFEGVFYEVGFKLLILKFISLFILLLAFSVAFEWVCCVWRLLPAMLRPELKQD